MGLLIDWTNNALCQEGDPDALFVQGAEQNNAKKVCRGCPVRLECLADALDNRIEFGVWGGMTERERRALLRKHPGVRSWRTVFEVALEEERHSVPSGNKELSTTFNLIAINQLFQILGQVTRNSVYRGRNTIRAAIKRLNHPPFTRPKTALSTRGPQVFY